MHFLFKKINCSADSTFNRCGITKTRSADGSNFFTPSVVSGSILTSVLVETVPALEIGIVLKLSEDPQLRLEQLRPP